MTEFVKNIFDLFTLRPMDSGFRRNDGMNFKMSTLTRSQTHAAARMTAKRLGIAHYSARASQWTH